MEAEQIIRYIQTAEKKTPVKVYFNSEREISLAMLYLGIGKI